MRSRRYLRTILFAAMAFPVWAAVANGCSAGAGDNSTSITGFGGEPAMSSGTSSGGNAATNGGGGSGGSGGGIVIPDSGPGDATSDVTNPCGSKCGPTELCDPNHLGIDDNCDYKVDEGCSCTPGQAHFCFKGDPSYRGTPGCFDGSERCTENGTWGPCVGGVHATPEDQCWLNNTTACHAIQTAPFVDIDLKTGTGNFSDGATTESWTVACPNGITPCPVPGPVPPSDYKALQSGEYTVTYQRTGADGGMNSCTYPLFVGAPGLRVELSWEHPPPASTITCNPNNPIACDTEDCLSNHKCSNAVDLDLHVHNPGNTQNWNVQGDSANDCAWSNCVIGLFGSGTSPSWFSNSAMPPDPVNWYLDPVMEKNTCYYDPRGVGQQWQQKGKGCHNPRLDSDNVDCDPTITDPNDENFCAPENINIDYPPKGVWTRVAAYYYGAHGRDYDVHPEIKIYCNGSLAADLGSVANASDPTMRDPSGYDAAVTFTPAQDGKVFWEAADVLFPEGSCATSQCIVQPLYADSTAKTPVFVNVPVGGLGSTPIGPAYPPIP